MTPEPVVRMDPAGYAAVIIQLVVRLHAPKSVLATLREFRSPHALAPSGRTIVPVQPPANVDTWVALTDAPLPVEAAYHWAVLPNCGGVVLFSGTVRDHAEGRPGVTSLEYEAYAEQVEPRLA